MGSWTFILTGVYCEVRATRAHSNRCTNFTNKGPTTPINRRGSQSTLLLPTCRRNLFVSVFYPDHDADSNAKRRYTDQPKTVMQEPEMTLQ
jgi:hypothetical protein